MKARGAKGKYTPEQITTALYEYENSELSWDEVAEKHGIPKSVLIYHRKKRRSMQEGGNSGTRTQTNV